MPNWCTNVLAVSGNDDDLTAFLTALGGTDPDKPRLSFNALVPMPAEMNDGDAWYGWRLEHWGTKWDLSDDDDQNVQLTDTDVSWQFDTAWGPPEVWLRTVAQRFPALTFQLAYDEPGMDFSGVLTITDGQEDEARSWQDRSMSWISCAVPDCPSSDNGPLEARYPDEFLNGPPPADTWTVYCDDHRLVEVVVAQINADKAAGEPA